MLARDINSQPTQYRTWVVDNMPDYTGQFYTGDKSGSNAFVDVSAYAIFNPNEVANFNLPNPLNWSTTYKTLPSYICDAQLAVIDGYIYLFGGQNSNKIFRSSVNNPATWLDTGATIPTPLAGSQLAIIDGYVYLFGGTTDATLTSATPNIYSALVSNPLNWTNNGPLLPRKLHHSQLAIIGNTIYLFGGNEVNIASNVILSAPTSNPLFWTDTGSQLPNPLYGSQLGIIDGYVYLFGGLLVTNDITSNIYSASLSQPLNWSITGNLPYPICYGQFATIGEQGYIYSATNTTVSYTRILQCNLSNPSVWTDTQFTINGTATQSHLAVIYDRMFLFGGNGSTVILASNPLYSFDFFGDAAFNYGNVTRTQADQAATELDLFQVLGFKPWISDYGSFNF